MTIHGYEYDLSVFDGINFIWSDEREHGANLAAPIIQDIIEKK